MSDSNATQGNKHHYVPRSHLKHWASNGRVGVADFTTGSRYKKEIANLAMERGFYAVGGHPADPEVIEKAFSSVERPADKVVARVAAGAWPLSLHDRVALGAFVTLQALRGPEQRRLMRSLQVDMVEREKRRVEDHGAAAWFADHGLRLTEERASAAWDSVVGEGRPLVTIDATYHAEQIARHADTVLPRLLERYWTLVRFERPTLFTSDAPVSLVDVQDGQPGDWGLLNAPSISVPLDRTTALVLGATYPSGSVDETESHWNGSFDREAVGNDAWAARLNARTVHNSSRALFHHPDDGALIPTELPPPRD